jgi:hypothetical protein
MSYDITTEPDTGLDWNYTYNIQPMVAKAGLHSLNDLDGMKARIAADALDSVLDKFSTDPDSFRELNPKNGWGDFYGFCDRLRFLRDHLRDHSETTVCVG